MTDSVFEEHVFRDSFWPNVKHLRIGHARNDLFFDPDKMESLRQSIHAFYKIPSHKKIVLYAPTFRNRLTDGPAAVHADFALLQEALTNRFGGEWVVLNRLHFHDAKKRKDSDSENSPDVIDASSYPDMQELLAAADAGITDYSSWIFDYLFTGRPAFLYAQDIQEYVNNRGFYYPLSETPFSISDCDQALAENIRNFSEESYHENVRQFLEEKGCYEKGTAARKAVDKLLL
jgi:CDP-glycerol glycerophosphotransferase